MFLKRIEYSSCRNRIPGEMGMEALGVAVRWLVCDPVADISAFGHHNVMGKIKYLLRIQTLPLFRNSHYVRTSYLLWIVCRVEDWQDPDVEETPIADSAHRYWSRSYWYWHEFLR